MGMILSTVASLMLVSGGTCGIDLLMERYATPEARSQAKSTTQAAEEECTRMEKRVVLARRRSGRR